MKKAINRNELKLEVWAPTCGTDRSDMKKRMQALADLMNEQVLWKFNGVFFITNPQEV